MYSTSAYLYQQKHDIFLISATGTYQNIRYKPVYSKNLKLNLGTDNVLLFQFLNQDQKPVNCTGLTFRFRIINQDGDQLLLTKELEVITAATGKFKLVVTKQELLDIPAQSGGYSIEKIGGSLDEPVFVDDYAGGRGVIDIVDSVYPAFVPSGEVTVPSYSDYLNSVWPANKEPQHYSSVWQNNVLDLVTVQLEFDKFTGYVKVQGAEDVIGPWYDIGPAYTYLSQEDPVMYNIAGTHNYLRLSINTSLGENANAQANVNTSISTSPVTALSLVPNNQGGGGAGGNGYISDPRVVISGVGAGATAVATETGGVVGTITLTAPGAGYTVTPKVIIDKGEITRILYR